jgi:hypothetical protein
LSTNFNNTTSNPSGDATVPEESLTWPFTVILLSVDGSAENALNGSNPTNSDNSPNMQICHTRCFSVFLAKPKKADMLFAVEL